MNAPGRDGDEIRQLGQERDRAIIDLASALNRYRGLTEAELDILEAAIGREQRALGQCREFWTPEHDASLRSLFVNAPVSSAANWASIGEQLDPPRTPFAVKRRIAKLGLTVAEHRSIAKPRRQA